MPDRFGIVMWPSNSVAAPHQPAQIRLFAEFGPRFVVCKQRPLGCCRQPILLGQNDWSNPFASGHWRVDTGAGGGQAHHHRDDPDGQ